MPEYIKISEYQRRVWGAGTPLTAGAIRAQIQRGDLPGKQIGKLWFIDWRALNSSPVASLVNRVLAA